MNSKCHPNRFETTLTWLLAAIMMVPGNLMVAESGSYPVVIERQINDGSSQRSTVTNLSLLFNTDISSTLAASNLFIRNLKTGTALSPSSLALAYDRAANRAVWTFPGFAGNSLPDGNYGVTLLANQLADPQGNRLDGNADGQPGDSYTFDLFRYFGDVNGDRDVDFADTFGLTRTYLKSVGDPLFDYRFDVNGDGLVNATDLAALKAHHFTLLDIEPGLFAGLVNDTGTSPVDRLTSDLMVAGTVLQPQIVSLFRARFDAASAWQNVKPDLSSDGTFRLTPQRLAEINGSPLPEGSHALHLQVVDARNNTSRSFDVPFTLDTTPPSLTLNLNAESDSPPVGDLKTTNATVILTGATEANLVVKLAPNDNIVAANSTGAFSFANVPLIEGTNVFIAQTMDPAGNQTTTTQSVVRLPLDSCLFDAQLTGWTIQESGGSTSAHGQVVAEDCSAVMTEGDSFLLTLKRPMVIPLNPGMLTIQYSAPSFDSSATNRMRDAFEAALVDGTGKPLTFTIQGAAGIIPATVMVPPALPASADAFLNHSDGFPPYVAPGVSLTQSPSSSEIITLAVDISKLAAASRALLILRLVNNDYDRATTVRIHEVRFGPLDSNLNFAGSPGTALSSFVPTSSAAVATAKAIAGSGSQSAQFSPSPATKTAAASPLLASASASSTSYTFPIATNITINSNYVVEIFASNIRGACALAYPPEGSVYGPNLYVTTDPTPVSYCYGQPSEVYRIAPDGVATRIALFNGSWLEASPWWAEFPPIGSVYGDQLYVSANDLAGDPCAEYDGGGTVIIVHSTGGWTNLTGIGTQNGGPKNPYAIAFGLGTAFGDHLYLTSCQADTVAKISIVNPDGSMPTFLDLDLCNDKLVMGKGPWKDLLILPYEGSLAGLSPRLEFTNLANLQPYCYRISCGRPFGTNIYALTADAQGRKIVRISTTGEQEAFAEGFGPAIGQYYGHVSRDSLEFASRETALFVSDWVNNRIYRITPKFFPADLFLSLNSTPASAPAGSVVSISGLAGYTGETLGGGTIVNVMVNNTPVEALDSAGDFYSTVIIKPGLNNFTIVAEDSFGVKVSSELTITGTQPNPATDFSRLGVVSGSVRGEYGRTSFNEKTRTLYAEMALRNAGSYSIRAPFYVGVTHISDPSVSLLAADGATADGIPYYDFTATLTNGVLNPSQASLSRTLAFANPNKVQFTYDLVVLGQLNQAPYFTTTPPLEVIAGHTYGYAANVDDPDGDALTYALLESPPGMTINPASGSASWTATNGVGSFNVRLRASDGRGGTAEQHYLLSAIAPPSNRPPYFVSIPVTTVLLGSQVVRPSDQSPYECIPTNGLIARWQGEGNATDSFGTHNGVPFNGLSYTQGVLGNAFFFNGTDSYIEVDYSETLVPGTNSFTFLAWVSTTTGGYVEYQYECGDYCPSCHASSTWSLGVNSNGNVIAGIRSTPSCDTYGVGLIGKRAINDGDFHLVAMSRDQERYQLRIYVDGALDAFVPLTFDSAGFLGDDDGEPDPILFGAYSRPNTTERFSSFSGIIDDVLFYHRTLADTEIQAIYDYGRLGGCIAGFSYVYASQAVDPDSDTLSYSLVVAPTNMTINPVTGLISWAPTTNDTCCTHPVTVMVTDGRGGTTYQSYSICVLSNNQLAVTPTNSAPFITSMPPGPAVVGLTYRYLMRAQDAENQPLTFALGSNAPAGMVLAQVANNFNAAVLDWTPGLTNIGTNRIEIIVRDSEGAEARQTFDLEVVASAANRPPVFTTSPRTQARIGLPWVYAAQASDPDGDPLSFQLVSAPAGMSLTNAQPSTPDSAFLLWTPTNLGSFTVSLAMSDSRAGGAVTQTFVITVSSTLSNSAPVIVSSPPLAGTAGQPYQYDLLASDADGDLLAWSLVTAPVGMSLDPNTGALRWIPTSNLLGTNTVTVQVQDLFLASDSQTFQVVVGCVNRSPQISSVPPVMANVGQLYLYAPRATDPDGDNLSWSIVDTNAAPGMTIDSTNGLVRWLPNTNQVGAHLVQVRVRDGRGGVDIQAYTLWVTDVGANHVPVIISSPQRGATVSRAYSYTFSATDADGDTLTLQALQLPTGATFTPGSSAEGSASAVVNWTPTLAQLGPNDFILVAKDPSLASCAQRFSVTVRSNLPPVITSDPPTNAVPGVTYRYDVAAYDSDGDPLTYTLAASIPSGLTMDNLGRIAWTPTLAQVGSYTLTATVADTFGATATQTFPIGVAADTQPPVVFLSLLQGMTNGAGAWFADIHSTFKVFVRASDNVGVTSLTLKMGTNDVALAANRVATIVPGTGGNYPLIATARDAAGNTGQTSNILHVLDPNAANSLVIQIQSPTNDTTVTRRVPVVASMSNSVPLQSYTVDFAPAGEVDLNNIAQPNAAFIVLTNVTLPTGVSNLASAVLATFDPTVLLNDTYLIRVSAVDQNANSAYEGVLVNVQGDLKFGEFRLEFTDLTVPVAGIPITVKRVYDSRLSRRVGDFGFGWSLGVQDARILVASPDGAVHQGTRIYLTGPDGRRLGFTAQIEVIGGAWIFANTRYALKADPGVYEKLDADGLEDFYIGHTPLFEGLDGPPRLQTVRLTTKDGLVYEYDKDRGLQHVTDLNGNQLTFTSQGIQHVLAGSGTVDQQVTFQRDAQGRIERIIDPTGQALNYTYDGAGDLRSFMDQATNLTQYSYHPLRPHYLETIIDPLGHPAIRSIFDDSGKLVAIVDALGHTNRQDFVADSLFGTFTDGNGHVTTNYFDDRGNTVMTIDPTGGSTEFHFDANNNEIWRKDPRGFITQRGYDSRGNLTNILDAASNVTAIAYSILNKPTSVTDARNHTTQFRYNERGDLTNVVNALGGQAFFTRDAQGRVTSVTDFNGHATIYDYVGGCSCGKPGKVINPDGTFRLYEYNSLGQTTREVNELGHETLSDFDSAGRPLWTRDAETNYTRYLYRGALKIAEIDPLNRTNWFGYDDANRIVAQTNAMGGVVRFEYDHGTNRTAVIDPVGNVTRFYYDDANRLKYQVDPWGRTNSFGYDAAGNRTEVLDRNGRKRTFGYDALNRRTNELWWEGTDVVRSIEFTFNGLGIMTGASDPASRLAFDFDALNRLERTTQSGVAGMPDFTLAYGYDGAANLVSVADNWGVQVASAYNARNQLVQRVWQGGGLPGASLRFDYDAAGNRTNILRYSDAAGTVLAGQSRYGFSPVGLITNILHASAAGATQAEYHYQRDSAQQIIARTLNTQLSTFNYDLIGQLTSALYSAGQPNEGYHFDANGNRIGGGYVVTTNNQIVADGTYTYSYDLEGSMVGRSNTVTHATTAYRYDHRNRLVSVVEKDAGGSATQTVEFTYDALNRRIAKSVNGTVTRFLLNQENIWADANGAGTITARYLLGDRIDEMMARYRIGEAVVWYLTDNLGTVRDLADSTGAVVNHVTVDSFGRILAQSAPAVGDRFLFAGREWDEETGLLFYRARYYLQDIGRFISHDPIGFSADEFNPYRYVGNSPLSRTDPTGTATLVEALWITGYSLLFAAAGSAAGIGILRFCEQVLPPAVPGFSPQMYRIMAGVGGLAGFGAGVYSLLMISEGWLLLPWYTTVYPFLASLTAEATGINAPLGATWGCIGLWLFDRSMFGPQEQQ